MERYDVYSSRDSLMDAVVPIHRSYGKLKREKSSLMDDSAKPPALKIPRHSPAISDDTTLTQPSFDANTISVLPRLLRSVTNGNCYSGHPLGTATVELVMAANGTDKVESITGPATNDTDSLLSASSSSSFLSTPSASSSSSGSSFISFLSPGQLGPVAALAASAFPTPSVTAAEENTITTAVPSETAEPSGLVTLATASSMIEKEWLARAALASDQAIATTTEATESLPSTSAEVFTLTLSQSSNNSVDGSSPLLFKTLTTSTSQSSNHPCGPTTPTMLDVQSLAALIRETQKQCSSRSTSATSLESPFSSVFSFPAETQATAVPSCTYTQVVSPNLQRLPQSTPVLVSTNDIDCCSVAKTSVNDHNGALIVNGTCTSTSPLPTITTDQQQQQQATALITVEATLPNNSGAECGLGSNTGSPDVSGLNQHTVGSHQQTAFISLQPAPGSILSSSDLQQLMSSGEFMSSAARTLLGQSPDGSTRQLYLLVPSDCPVIMSHASNNSGNSGTSNNTGQQQQQCLDLGSSSPPLINPNVNNGTAPILEAISPGIEPPESGGNANDMPNGTNTASLPQLANAVLAPVCSNNTLSTLIAGLEVRNHQTLQQASSFTHSQPAVSSSPMWFNRSNNNGSNMTAIQSSSSSLLATAVATIDATAGGSRLHLPVTLSEHGGANVAVQSDQPATPYHGSGTVNNLLGSVKSDPDMYTPNGHPYASLVDDVCRFRPYTAYSQSAVTNQLPPGTTRSVPTGAGSSVCATSSTAFFQSDVPNTILLSPGLMATSVVSDGGQAHSQIGQPAVASHHHPHHHHLLQPSVLPRVSSTTALMATSTASTNAAVTLLPATSKSVSVQLEDSRRNVSGPLLATSGNSHVDQAPAPYLEHMNPETKDIRRRVSHNEVERRRRDRINTWISELYKLLPPDEQAKSQYQSKGVVLRRVCEYFQNVDSMLKAANSAVEQTRVENGILRQRVRELQQDNQLLSASLQLGAVAAAAHLKNRQPRSSSSFLHSSSDDVPSDANDTNGHHHHHQLTAEEQTDYSAPVMTVFTVSGGNGSEYNHSGNGSSSGFNQQQSSTLSNVTGVLPVSSIPSSVSVSTGFTHLSIPVTSTVFASHRGFITSNAHGGGALSPTNSNLMHNGNSRSITLPSLDMVAGHVETRTE